VALRISITDVSAQGAGVWSVRLTPADVRRLGDSRSSFGCRSVLATTGAIFNDATRELSVAPGATTVLNIGATDDALVIEVGQRGDVVEAEDAEAEDTIKSYNFIESVAGHRKTLERRCRIPCGMPKAHAARFDASSRAAAQRRAAGVSGRG